MVKDKVAHWQDARRQADIWHMIIKRATMARLEGNYKEYGRAIDTIVPTMFKEERELVKQYADTLNTDDMIEAYDALLENIIDVLETKGYLSKKYATSSIDEGIGDESIGGDEDGLEKQTTNVTD